MEKTNDTRPVDDSLRILGAMVCDYMHANHVTTEWLRRDSHFGNTQFTQLKKGN